MSSSSSIRFTRSCPTCGRRVEIRASLLGDSVVCQHCQAEFVASVVDDDRHQVDENHRLMARVQRVLDIADNTSVA